MYKYLAGIFLAAVSLCFSQEAQAAGLLEDPVSVQENSLYERIGSDRIRIGAQVYPAQERGSLLQRMTEEKEQKLQEEKEAKERGRKEEQKGDTRGEKNEELSKTEKKRESLSVLQGMLEGSVRAYAGTWEIYVEDLDSGESFSIGDGAGTSASLIKMFVMAGIYEQVEQGILEETPQLDALLEAMITVSDNEAFNELVRQLGNGDFVSGCQVMNQYLAQEGYAETGVHHTLHPSSTVSQGDGLSNQTSVRDCGTILGRIYRGECVSEEASRKMLDFLLAQETDWKIPAGIPEEIPVANKTGETDTCQHDAAIVYAPQGDYILCVMSFDLPDEETGAHEIQQISAQTYEFFLGESGSE